MVVPARNASKKPASLASRARPAASTSASDPARHERDAVDVGHHPVPRRDQHAAHPHRGPHRARLVLRRAGERDGRREHREAVRLQRGDVAHAAVEDQSRQPGRLGRRRQHLAPVPAVGHATHVDDEHAAPRRLRHRHVHGQVVPGRAADRVGRGGQRRAGPGRPEPPVGGPPAGLAQRRRAQRGQCRRDLVLAVRSSHLSPRAVPVPPGLLPSRSRAFDHRAGPAHQPYTPAVPEQHADRHAGGALRRRAGRRPRRPGAGRHGVSPSWPTWPVSPRPW